MSNGDDVGDRGEAIFRVSITHFCGHERPWFKPHFLGEKFPALDFFVELVGAGPKTPYFFVQVRATRQGYTRRRPPRLKVSVAAEDVRRIALYPGPTYLVGIDEPQSMAYVVAIHGTMDRAIPSLPTNHRLDCRNLERLWLEVKEYWDERDMTQKRSVFSI